MEALYDSFVTPTSFSVPKLYQNVFLYDLMKAIILVRNASKSIH